MIDLSSGVVIQGKTPSGRPNGEEIKRWEVWFKTPFGYCVTLEEAVQAVGDQNMKAFATIQPIPVAVTETMKEVYDH